MMNPIALVVRKVWLRKAQRQDRLGGARLDEREQCEQRDAADDRCEHPGRGPRIARAAKACVEDDPRQSRGEHDRAEIVDPVPLGRLPGTEGNRDHRERDRAEREVDVEDPPPGEVVDEEAAEQRPGDGRDPENASEHALVAAALARRDEVADYGQRHHHQAAAAEPLHEAEGDQLRHALRQPAQNRADQEKDERDLQDRFAPVEIAQLAVQRPDHRRRQQVGGHYPGEVLQAAQVADDRRERRRHDRLVERRDEQHEQQRGEDEAPPGRARLTHRSHLLGQSRRASGGRRSAAL